MAANVSLHISSSRRTRRRPTRLLYIAGFNRQPALPEADPVNFRATREGAGPDAERPLRLLLPYRDLARADVQTARDPCEHKHRVVYDSSRRIPRNEMIKEVVGWMEKYWGAPIR
jgi:hypothetical protein